MEYTHCWGPHWHWVWIIPFFFMILMFTLAARARRRGGAWGWCCGNRAGWRPEQDSRARWASGTPLEILDLRYASGEITREEYEEMKRNIESRSAPSGPNAER